MSIILTWGLEAYLVEGTSINEIKFKFYRFPDGRPDMPTSEYVVPAKRNYNWSIYRGSKIRGCF